MTNTNYNIVLMHKKLFYSAPEAEYEALLSAGLICDSGYIEDWEYDDQVITEG